MRPDKSGLLISVENWSKGQCLRVIETQQTINTKAYQELQEFTQKHNCPYIIMRYYKTIELHGPDDFIQEKR
jgi:tryptophan synthase alpha subunit